MSDLQNLHDNAPQDWSAGVNKPRHWPDRAPWIKTTSQNAQDAPGDERERGHEEVALSYPPLSGASLERLQLCRDALAIVLLEAGVGIRDCGRMAALCVRRLQEPLDAD